MSTLGIFCVGIVVGLIGGVFVGSKVASPVNYYDNDVKNKFKKNEGQITDVNDYFAPMDKPKKKRFRIFKSKKPLK